MKPLDVLVEHGGNAAGDRREGSAAVPGVAGAAAPAGWHRGADSIVEAFPTIDGAAPGIQAIVDRVNQSLKGTNGTLGGTAAVDRDFVHAVYGNFPYVLAFVVILTLILLARAFRSIVLAIKAAILNLVSLAAAFGIVVFIFQEGHGSSLWNITATHAITAWIPLMIFAFLFGLSMDYEVFMLTRMREAYDETGSTEKAIELGLARTGQARHERRADPDVRVPRALVEPGLRDQGVRDRPGRGDHLRRDGDPGAARPGADAPARPGQLVDAGLDAHAALYSVTGAGPRSRDRSARSPTAREFASKSGGGGAPPLQVVEGRAAVPDRFERELTARRERAVLDHHDRQRRRLPATGSCIPNITIVSSMITSLSGSSATKRASSPASMNVCTPRTKRGSSKAENSYTLRATCARATPRAPRRSPAAASRTGAW